MILTRLVRDHLWSAPEGVDSGGVAAHARAITIVRAFYAVGLMWAVQDMDRWQDIRTSTVIDPLWPAAWVLDLFGRSRGLSLVLAAYAAFALAAAALPRLRLLRLGYSASLLLYLAITNGSGKINHGMHAWFWVSLFLVLIPTGREAWRSTAGPELRRSFVHALLLSQFCLLTFYTLTGLWKLGYATTALFGPEVSAFQIDGFSYLLGKNLLATGRATLAGEFLLDHPVVGWALFNLTMYLEATSILITFRPRLHRVWGIGLILFHIGTMASMGILFPANLVLIGLLLLCSPLAPDALDLRAAARDLPGVHLISRQVARRRTSAAPGPTKAPAEVSAS